MNKEEYQEKDPFVMLCGMTAMEVPLFSINEKTRGDFH